ncbi:helix-turn-helix domain-containing protein [Citrobacter portucalensis]
MRKTDLNLLLIFDSLYRHGSVTEAANEMALSPSALSHALNRLRASLDDPLFVRTGGRMVPTSKAESIAANVSAALSSLSLACMSLNTLSRKKAGRRLLLPLRTTRLR